MDLALGFERGSLKGRLDRTTLRARQLGKLLPIHTERRVIEDGGVRFVVRRAISLVHKDIDAAATSGDPFDAPDPDMVVADVSDRHLCVLNKYNVLDNHLLVVTRSFEDQESLLTMADFAALWICLREFDGLGFYNGGHVAGASQPHKHLQVVPLPLDDEGPSLPIRPLLDAALPGHLMITVPGLPYPHAFARLDPDLGENVAAAAAVTYEIYRAMLEILGIAPIDRDGNEWQSAPYNLLVANDWVMLVPRRRERIDDISVNALGFAGSLFVRDDAQMALVAERGPMAILRGVAT